MNNGHEKMRIVLEPQGFLMQRYGGVSRYVVESYAQFLKNENVEVKCPMLYSENMYLIEKNLAPRFMSFFHNIRFKGKGTLLKHTFDKYAEKLVLDELKRQQFDVFFATVNEPYFLKELKGKPFIMTVHDMINELFPQYFPKDTKTIENKLLLMKHATRITTVSQNSKNDILKLYPFIPADKIDVTPSCHSLTQDYKAVNDLPENYLLFVGARSRYKNFNFFIEAASEVLKKDDTLFIVCAGGGNFSDEEKERITKYGISDRVIQKYFHTDELSYYYRHARLFVFPSAYEGFGIPVLEAMYCDCPIILPYHSSFPEVAGDAGIFFELNNKEDLVDKLLLILNNASLRNEYVQKGKLQVKKYTWENTANGCLRTMELAIEQSI